MDPDAASDGDGPAGAPDPGLLALIVIRIAEVVGYGVCSPYDYVPT